MWGDGATASAGCMRAGQEVKDRWVAVVIVLYLLCTLSLFQTVAAVHLGHCSPVARTDE